MCTHYDQNKDGIYSVKYRQRVMHMPLTAAMKNIYKDISISYLILVCTEGPMIFGTL